MSATSLYRNALPDGSTLLEYRVESVLGAGGFGITYLCHDTHLDKRVAIKEYFPSDLAVRALDGGVISTQTDNEDSYRWGLERFTQEARTLAKFSHPHIVRVYRYFEANDTGYMVMDYEDGESLHQSLKLDPTPRERQVRELLFPLLDGLQAVHQAGVLHRDIKPSNIFVRKRGGPVLLDFGSARQAASGATKTLTAVLTPGFAPLEQYTGDGNQGPWTDVYAMGGVLYRVFTGENPPDAVSRLKNDTVPAKIATLIGRVSLPVLRSVEWAMLLDEKSRPQNVLDWRRALEGKAAEVIAPRAAAADAPARSVVLQRASVPVRARPRPAEDISRTWRSIGKGVIVLIVLAVVYTWFKRNVVIMEEPPDMESAMAQAQQDAMRVARETAQREKTRIVKLPPGAELRTPEQVALDEREAAVREKEQRAAEREAALKQGGRART